MVRNYIKKGAKGKWKEEDMIAATDEVKGAKMTVFGVFGVVKHFHILREML